ncbi:MAG: hypothetical protein N2652_00700 [Kiritimatiellae bacterium]|nr:hypothetical protein [Kiritimatiellia bacterium]
MFATVCRDRALCGSRIVHVAIQRLDGRRWDREAAQVRGGAE